MYACFYSLALVSLLYNGLILVQNGYAATDVNVILPIRFKCSFCKFTCGFVKLQVTLLVSKLKCCGKSVRTVSGLQWT